MEDKRLLTILEVLAVKIKELESDLNYERILKNRAETDLMECKKEIDKLKTDVMKLELFEENNEPK